MVMLSFLLSIRLDKLKEIISYVLESKVCRKDVAKKWIGNKVSDWNDVTKRLEDIYS